MSDRLFCHVAFVLVLFLFLYPPFAAAWPESQWSNSTLACVCALIWVLLTPPR